MPPFARRYRGKQPVAKWDTARTVDTEAVTQVLEVVVALIFLKSCPCSTRVSPTAESAVWNDLADNRSLLNHHIGKSRIQFVVLPCSFPASPQSRPLISA
jgi:hypothetical protein